MGSEMCIRNRAEVVPEWGHNDIVGWEGWKEPIAAVVFREVT